MTSNVFTNSSLAGSYAVAVAGEGGRLPYAALGLLSFDGAGGVSGYFSENRPGPSFSERSLVDTPYRRRYSVSANGLGTVLPEDSDEIDCYLAVRAVVGERAGTIAHEIALVFRGLDPLTGSLRTGVGLRRPDRAVFNNASLHGRYTGFAVGRGGQLPMAGLGVLAYDGAGGFAEENVANVQGEAIGVRQFVNGTDQGRFAVNGDGVGSVADGGVLLVITRATIVDGVARADEYSFMGRDLVPTNGAHFTGVVRRISD